MKIYITKHALTSGILEIDGKISKSNPEIVSDANNKYGIYCGKDKAWTDSLEKAKEIAEEMRLKKIQSLKKKLKKLEGMTF